MGCELSVGVRARVCVCVFVRVFVWVGMPVYAHVYYTFVLVQKGKIEGCDRYHFFTFK